MTLLEADLKNIKMVIMQKRGAYHISETDKEALRESLARITKEVEEIL